MVQVQADAQQIVRSRLPAGGVLAREIMSSPVVSIGPILALAELRDAVAAARAVAVSPIVAGRALKGPADRMLASLGEESSALGVARHLVPLISRFVLDRVDVGLEEEISTLGVETLVADTIMTDDAARARLAEEVLAFATSTAGTSP